jgi:GAF domain-containing protein
MAETQPDVRHLPKAEAYRTLSSHFDAVCEDVSDPIAAMSTMACLLHFGFGFLWTGFYRRISQSRLIVGPYQGTLGCLEIELGRGVCGTAAADARSVVVPDVREFPGHIACDARSLSEIVVPVFDARGEVVAVLDVDSERVGTFDSEDQRQLESLVTWFARNHTSPDHGY